MQSLKAFFGGKKENIPRDIDEKTLFFLFQKIVQAEYGERGGSSIQPVFFREGVLGVRTKSPLWANELWLMKSSLCEKLNQEIGTETIRDLKLLH